MLLSFIASTYFGLTGFIIGLAVGSIIGVITVQVWMSRQGIVLSFYELKLSIFFFLVIALYYGAAYVISGEYQKEILAIVLSLVATSFLYFSYKVQISAYLRK